MTDVRLDRESKIDVIAAILTAGYVVNTRQTEHLIDTIDLFKQCREKLVEVM